jgi:SPFH domain / Band 7 family
MAKRVHWWEVVIWVFLFLSACAFFLLGPTSTAFLLLLLLLLILLVRLVMVTCIHTVGEHERLLVSRFGKDVKVRGPGVVWTMPLRDSAVRVDQREHEMDVSGVHCITRDGSTIDVDFSFFWRIVNVELATTAVDKLGDAVKELATSTLQAAIGPRNLAGVLQDRQEIDRDVLNAIGGSARRWGVQVTGFTTRRIRLPQEVQDAYTKQAEAGRAQQQETRSRVDALLELDEVAGRLTNKEFVMGMVALDTLSKIGEAKSTKYLLPMELAGLIRPLTQSLGGVLNGARPSGGPDGGVKDAGAAAQDAPGAARGAPPAAADNDAWRQGGAKDAQNAAAEAESHDAAQQISAGDANGAPPAPEGNDAAGQGGADDTQNAAAEAEDRDAAEKTAARDANTAAAEGRSEDAGVVS